MSGLFIKKKLFISKFYLSHREKSVGLCVVVSHFLGSQRVEVFLTIPVFQEHRAQDEVQHCHSQSGY